MERKKCNTYFVILIQFYFLHFHVRWLRLKRSSVNLATVSVSSHVFAARSASATTTSGGRESSETSSHFFKKWAIPGLFSIYFRLFIQTSQFLQQINVKEYPSSLRCSDSNPRPSKHESPPITTRQGSHPCRVNFYHFLLSLSHEAL